MNFRLLLKPSLLWQRFERFWSLTKMIRPDEAKELLGVLTGFKERKLNPSQITSLLAEIDNLEELEYLKFTHKQFGQILKRRHIYPDQSAVALENIEAFFNLGILEAPVEKNLYRNWGTFAQEGEDLILHRLLGSSGFYVDVGAHHPFRFSNTALLYDHGWNGICIEPNPDGFEKIREFRPRDIVLNVAVLNQKQAQKISRTFYMFEEGALNTFDRTYAEEMQSQGFPLRSQVNLPSRTLSEIFSEHASDRKIDLLSVDCEGSDLEVLESNDWSIWTPRVVVAEIVRQKGMTTSVDTAIETFLLSKGYLMFSRLYNSVIWIHKSY